MAASLQYQVPDSLVGKTINQLRQGQYNSLVGLPSGDANGLNIRENELPGISFDSPLTSGQTLNYSTDDPTYQGSGQFQSLNKYFGSALSPEQQASNASKSATSAALDSAKQIRQFNIDSAAPQIATMQSGKTDLKSRYSDLLATIKGDQGQAVNRATLNTSNELGRRGIVGGGYYDTQLADSAQQAGQPFEGLYAQTSQGQTQDLNSIDNQIAALQSGNPAGAFSGATQLGGLSNQAASLSAQIAQNQQQNQQFQQQLTQTGQQQAFNQRYITIPGYGIYDVSKGSLVGGVNTSPYSISNPTTGNRIIG